MEAWAHSKTLDRYDRHVQSARMSVAPHTPVHSLTFMIEEALRLASLPGENEGRFYYFRRLRITGVPTLAARRAWLESFQRALNREAQQAVHGTDPRAGSANAVFFRGEQEALEILLYRVLSRQAIREWFWPMVTARDSLAESVSIVDIIERLRDRPASWVAVAAAIFASPGFDAVRMLQAIPAAVAEGWLRELAGPSPQRGWDAPRIPPQVFPAVAEALRVFGFSSPRVLWLATLSVLLHSPVEMAAGTAVWRARAALQQLAGSTAGDALVTPPPETSLIATQDEDAPSESWASSRSTGGPERLAPAAPEPLLHPSPFRFGQELPAPPKLGATPERLAPSRSLDAPFAETPGTEPARSETTLPIEPGTWSGPPVPLLSKPVPTAWFCSGAPTDAAGLFFLLNALRQIGVPDALAAGLARAGPDFPIRVLQRLAEHAEAEPDDPIPLWLNSLLAPDSGGGDLLPDDAFCWPVNLRLSRPLASRDDMVRVWCLAVRRWCWRVAGISVREVISRSGVFSVNRTDLDVSLQLDQTDVRVRRAGLDLDPGWLPWFGRVVRFHYLFRGEFRA